MTKVLKRFFCAILFVIMFISGLFSKPLFPFFTQAKSASIKSNEEIIKTVSDVANGIIKWKKADLNANENENLINDKYLELAGTTPGDWYQIGLSRLGVKDNYQGYLAVIKDKVRERYETDEKLSAAKATEWHRISLAVLAAGGDPTDMGKDKKGNTINLIADGTYNRGKTASLGKQGINGWIWGLIALDSMRYEIPSDAFYTRDDIIKEILSRQLPSGGFTLSGTQPDPDITAMALQALAPYCESEKEYIYNDFLTDEKRNKTVKKVVDEALNCLSKLQLESGDFESWGTVNVESTDQVTVALCCLNINPLTDKRFIKNGNTLLDGILKYRTQDGGIAHSFTYSEDNPTAKAGKSNSMAGEQTLYTMAALMRFYKNQRPLYDFRAEKGTKSVNAEFTKEDAAAADALPKVLTTKEYSTVVTLLERLQNSEDFNGKSGYLKKLNTAKEEITKIEAEIASINADIKSELYPFEKLTVKDKGKIDGIVKRYEALSKYDREKIERYEDVVKSKTKVDNLLRGYIIGAVLAFSAAVIAVFTARSIIKKRRKKQREMEQLEKLYEDEE